MSIGIKTLGRTEFVPTFDAMRAFTLAREDSTADEIWLCEHPPVFTQGLAGKPEHILEHDDTPIVATDRGGQVTFHGPGQVVAYPLIDLRRAGYFVKEYVYRVEESVIKSLAHFGVTGHRILGAPGIYVRIDDPLGHQKLQAPESPEKRFDGLGKIAALGIKVTRHRTYHGVALNVDMDLRPFGHINPCGYAGLNTVDLSTIGIQTTWNEAASVLGQKLSTYLEP